MSQPARRAAERRGTRAEILAALLLRAKGYRILERRFRSRAGEIDLVARRGRHLAFVEVKARARTEQAAWALSPRQRARIARAAEHWLAMKGEARDLDMSFDVVLIAPWAWPRHIVSAFRV
ncbi:MAG: YraN family protein [Methyloligellaceae bacterium]